VDSGENSKTHLILGDSHSKPQVSNERYLWFARMILDIRPHVVVDIGDFFDMESLCSYDKGKSGWERRSYADDIECGLEAQSIIKDTIYKYNKKRHRKYRCKPRMVRCLGNHENRINRALSEQPELSGTVGLHSLKSKEYGWEEHPFLHPVQVDGVVYCHYFTSGVLGRPIASTASTASALISKKSVTCIQGHSHTLDYAEKANAMGFRVQAFSCGCYMEHEEDYAGPQVNKLWARGALILRGVGSKDGFSFEWKNIGTIRELYS